MSAEGTTDLSTALVSRPYHVGAQTVPSVPMPALTPASDLDILDHVTRLRSGQGGPAWAVSVSYGGRDYARRFLDRGDPLAALADAVAWRDETVTQINLSHGRRGAARQRADLGVRVTTTRKGEWAYPVVIATVPESGDLPRKRHVRSIDKYGYEEAIRLACQLRFEGMRERFGDEYPYASADELAADVLTAEGVPQPDAPQPAETPTVP